MSSFGRTKDLLDRGGNALQIGVDKPRRPPAASGLGFVNAARASRVQALAADQPRAAAGGQAPSRGRRGLIQSASVTRTPMGKWSEKPSWATGFPMPPNGFGLG